MAERLCLAGVRRAYGSRVVLHDLSFSVADGELLALLGLSGSGKTTALNLIAGLDRPDAGRISIDGQIVFGAGIDIAPHARGVGIVFQDQLLWPHLTAAAHLDFVLKARRVPKAERPARIAAQLEAVHLQHRRDAKPAELSGGERQRLSIARALVARPSLLLLDEPCANLDAPLKTEFLALLLELRAQNNFSAVYVTHDAHEAFELATRVAVLDGGRLVQCGAPHEICAQPATLAVARIVGGGTLLAGTLAPGGQVTTALGAIALNGTTPPVPACTAVTLYVRTDNLRVDATGELQAHARSSYRDGQGWMVVLDAGGTALRARADAPVANRTTVRLSLRHPPQMYLG